MKKLILVLFVGLLLFACKDNPMGGDTKKEFEPYRIGNWLVTSKNSAELFGDTQKTLAKGDTTVINSLDNQLMQINVNEVDDNNAFELTITDSSIVSDTVLKYDLSKFELFFPDETNVGYIEYFGKRVAPSPTATVVTFNLQRRCRELPAIYNIDYTIASDSSHYKTYRFDVDGFSATLDSLVGC